MWYCVLHCCLYLCLILFSSVIQRCLQKHTQDDGTKHFMIHLPGYVMYTEGIWNYRVQRLLYYEICIVLSVGHGIKASLWILIIFLMLHLVQLPDEEGIKVVTQ